MLFDRSYALAAQADQTPTVTQQRALACALECVQREHKEAGVSLRLKVAIACGSVFVAEVGRAERWELFVGGPALHALGHAAHDVPVGCVVVAKDSWGAMRAFAQGDVLPSGHARLSRLLVSVQPEPALLAESDRLYEDARLRADVNAAVAPFVPLSARLRLSELSASHLNDYRESTCGLGAFMCNCAKKRFLLSSFFPPLQDPIVVAVMFCSLLSSEKLSDSLDVLQSVCCVTLSILERYRGTLRQFLHEDKGVTVIALFGLPGSNFSDDSTRAVRAAIRLNRELAKLKIGSAIGITTGRIFCGSVGSKYEVAILIVLTTIGHGMSTRPLVPR